MNLLVVYKTSDFPPFCGAWCCESIVVTSYRTCHTIRPITILIDLVA